MRRDEVRAAEAHSIIPRSPRAAVRRALDLLGRASEDWRGNGAAEVGPLHWPVAVNLARCELRQAIEALEDSMEPGADRPDTQADAWRLFQAGGPQS